MSQRRGKLIESEKQLVAKTEQFRSKKEVIKAKARAEAVDELQAAGSFEDLTAPVSGQDDVDRQLDRLGAKSVVDDEFARLKAEFQSGAPQSALPVGDTGTADHAEAQQPAAGDGEAPLPVSSPDPLIAVFARGDQRGSVANRFQSKDTRVGRDQRHGAGEARLDDLGRSLAVRSSLVVR